MITHFILLQFLIQFSLVTSSNLEERFEKCKKEVFQSKLKLPPDSPLERARDIIIQYTTRANGNRLVDALLHDQRPPRSSQRCYYKSPCLKIRNLKINTRIISGCDKSQIISVYQNLDNTSNYRTTSNADQTLAYTGTSTLVKTDYKTYMLYFCCFPLPETKGFTLLTTTAKLSQSSIRDVEQFLHVNGFSNPWNYDEMFNHETCQYRLH